MRDLAIIFILISFAPACAQKLFQLDASKLSTQVPPHNLKMGNAGTKDRQLQVNSRYLSFNERPIIPVMGEVHYSRIPRSQWEDVILRMKAGGVNIVASYVIWIHHEEIEGAYDWEGNKSLREFAELCHKHGLWFYPRIGPWVHGEVRNGGTPDWILTKKLVDRSNDPLYQSYVKKWYSQIGLQLQGLYLKDNGPIIGIQLENEYARGKEGENHVRWLKQTAIKMGMDVPLYTVTGWGNASVPENEVIPLWGAYPDEPWDPSIERSANCENFRFTSRRNDDAIGNDLEKGKSQDIFKYPYFTCEMGIGIQNTDHRRLQIDKRDGLALMMAKLGSGSNLIGYYVFTGGENPVGKLSTLEENRESTGYWNTNPKIEYDFQAAIRGSGINSPAYHELKRIHYFLSEFGDRLAPLMPVFQKKETGFQFSARSDGKTAFVFGINYCRHVETPVVKDVRFEIQLKNEKVTFPQRDIQIPDSAIFFWPVNFELDQNVVMNYATAQVICKTKMRNETTWIFSQTRNIPVEILIRAEQVQNVSAPGGKLVKNNNGDFLVQLNEPVVSSLITITDKQNSRQHILVISDKQASEIWLLNGVGRKHVMFSPADLVLDAEKLKIMSLGNQVTMHTLGTDLRPDGEKLVRRQDGPFGVYTFKHDPIDLPVKLNPISFMHDALWIRTGVPEIKQGKELFHRFLKKQFNLANEAMVDNVRFYFFTETPASLQVNGKWVQQELVASKPNVIDLTGYVRSGENDVIIEFPFSKGSYGCVGKIRAEFQNGARIEFPTDDSWMLMDSYTYPAARDRIGKFHQCEFIEKDTVISFDKIKRYQVFLPVLPSSLNNGFVNINYVGDKAALYGSADLVADNFNNEDTWQLGLNRLRSDRQDFTLELLPLNKVKKIYFDAPDARTRNGEADVTAIEVLPEYKFEINLAHQK